MKTPSRLAFHSRVAILGLGLLVGLAAWFLLVLHMQYGWRPGGTSPITLYAALGDLASGSGAALGNLPEVVVAVLGIAVTVVSIIVQLAATRYTPQVTQMFFRDRTNLAVLGFFVITSVHCLWASFVTRGATTSASLGGVTFGVMTAAILLLIPYFAYIFAFVEPERIIRRLQGLAQSEARRYRRGGQEPAAAQGRVIQAIEQLTDVAVNATIHKDRLIASRAVDALCELTLRYAPIRGELPPSWFELSTTLTKNPDFAVMAPQSLASLRVGGSWVEFKVLRQYQVIFNECINRMRDMNQLLAINTKRIAQGAIATEQPATLELAVKFFNTYLRTAINHQDIRTAYNVLHQYRQLAEALLQRSRGKDALRLTHYFCYYARAAHDRGLSFVAETVAYDLAAICETAREAAAPEEAEILRALLTVDKAPESESEEISLKGVRKAQVKLATFYLARGDTASARTIWEDMAHEPVSRLVAIYKELLSVEGEAYWEIIDRGSDLDYLDAARRDRLDEFFSWFELRAG